MFGLDTIFNNWRNLSSPNNDLTVVLFNVQLSELEYNYQAKDVIEGVKQISLKSKGSLSKCCVLVRFEFNFPHLGDFDT